MDLLTSIILYKWEQVSAQLCCCRMKKYTLSGINIENNDMKKGKILFVSERTVQQFFCKFICGVLLSMMLINV